jgi:hypothetical protein
MSGIYINKATYRYVILGGRVVDPDPYCEQGVYLTFLSIFKTKKLSSKVLLWIQIRIALDPDLMTLWIRIRIDQTLIRGGRD